MSPIYKRSKYKNIMPLNSHPLYNLQNLNNSNFVTIKPGTLTIQPQIVELIILKWKGFVLKNSQFLPFQITHQIAKGTIFQPPRIQNFFMLLLQATDTSLTLEGWTQPTPIKERDKSKGWIQMLHIFFFLEHLERTKSKGLWGSWIIYGKFERSCIEDLSLIHIWRCRRIERCRSRWSPYH